MKTMFSAFLYRLLIFIHTLCRPVRYLSYLVNMGHGFAWIKLNYKPRPDDIFIVSYPKSGTTWLQMILYQLTTDGNMDFPHIATVSPHVELPEPVLIPDVEALSSPRIFKSHLRRRRVPRGPGKYIYIMRNGLDVVTSYFHHYVSFHGYGGTFEQFFRLFITGKAAYGSWFTHLTSWRSHKKDLDILYLHYEDLIEDLEGGIRKISAFLNLDIAEGEYARILERCSFKFMKEHQEKFDPAHKAVLRYNLSFNNFIRKGIVNDWKNQLTPSQVESYRQAFAKYMGNANLDRYKPSNLE